MEEEIKRLFSVVNKTATGKVPTGLRNHAYTFTFGHYLITHNIIIKFLKKNLRALRFLFRNIKSLLFLFRMTTKVFS